MTKLKIGDRVRVTQEGEMVGGLKEHHAKLGEEGIVKEIMFGGELFKIDFGRLFPQNGKTSQLLESHEIEKID